MKELADEYDLIRQGVLLENATTYFENVILKKYLAICFSGLIVVFHDSSLWKKSNLSYFYLSKFFGFLTISLIPYCDGSLDSFFRENPGILNKRRKLVLIKSDTIIGLVQNSAYELVKEENIQQT